MKLLVYKIGFVFVLLLATVAMIIETDFINYFKTGKEEIENVEIKPIGTISKFHKANYEGDVDEYIYIVAYEFETLEEAVNFMGE